MSVQSDDSVRRRKGWPSGLATGLAAASLDAAFWRNASVADKLDALRTMADDVAVMEGHGSTARLQRHLGGVRRSRG
ncbi:MAG: hypothetical protein ACHQ53_16900 [Polyangiales bacterium]